VKDLATLRAAVAVMRELGVTRWGEIELGSAPMAPSAPVKETPVDQREALRSRLAVMLRSSGVAPNDAFVERLMASKLAAVGEDEAG
jgi:hypothetical protein